MITRVSDIPEEYKIYTIFLSNKHEYRIGGITKKNIMSSNSQFVELDNGEIINKSFIVNILFEKQATKDWFMSLPTEEQKRIYSRTKLSLSSSSNTDTL